MEPKVVHEAEVHRQHVRLKIPIDVEIDENVHKVDDWSIGGFGVERELVSRQPGERVPVKLIFPFEDFEVSLRLTCQVVYIDGDADRYGCRFLELSAGQSSLFRYLVDAYLSGELLSAGDVLSAAGRDNSDRSRTTAGHLDFFAEEASLGRRIRQAGMFALFGVVTVGFLGVLFVGVKDRYFTFNAEAAMIEAPLFPLRASIAGTLEPAESGTLLRQGAIVASLQAADGQTATLSSPCECVISEWLIAPGQFAQQGDIVAVLAAADQPLQVRARVPSEQAQRLRKGDLAEIWVPGRDGTMRGQIEKITFKPKLSALLEGADDLPVHARQVQIVIRPDEPFEFEDLGSLVTVRFL